MKRSMMQIYVKESGKAVELYLRAEGSEVLFQLGPCDFSPLMTDFIDKFGVRWCLFV